VVLLAMPACMVSQWLHVRQTLLLVSRSSLEEKRKIKAILVTNPSDAGQCMMLA